MSTTTAPTPVYGESMDVSSTPRISMSTLVKVEMRKMADTRAGMWLLITIAAVSVIVIAAFFIWGNDDQRQFLDLFGYAGIPQGVLLPVLGILLVTQEWGQRTALVTFTHTPHRSKVLTAKVSAALLFALAAMVVAAVVAVPLALVGGGDHPFAEVTIGILARITLGLVLGILWGLAFGGALLNSAFAIVLYFLVPTIFGILSGVWPDATDVLQWFDFGTNSNQLFNSENLTGQEWSQLLVSGLLFLGVPAVIGVLRIVRSEVK